MHKETARDVPAGTRGKWRGNPVAGVKGGRTWKDIWEDRSFDTARPTLLARLLAANGYDSGFAHCDEARFRSFVAATGRTLDVTPGSSIFEVGCGAGAYLLPFYETGCAIGGLDFSTSLIGIARSALPRAEFVLAQATALDPQPLYDVVVSCGVFLYFPSLAYAHDVLALMLRKARRAIGILDVPDAARREADLAMRRGRLGRANYEHRYRGLDHLYFSREWFHSTLTELGACEVIVRNQSVADWPNGAFRYNVFAWSAERCRTSRC